MRNFVFVLALVCLIWAVNAVWLIHDTRPPLWDMAAHQSYALNYLDNAPSDLSFWSRSWNYPPFVHIVIAIFFRLLHAGPHVAILANLPATFLLLWGVFELACMLAGTGAARWACILAALTPFLIWMSRETILDYWLCAWVAVSLMLLVKSDGFQSRSASLLFGLTCAFGLLTKWLFPAFLALPGLYVIIRYRIWRSRRRILHLAWAVLLTSLISGIWYIPNLPGLIRFYFYNTQVGASEGEPPILSFQSVIYYLRLLEGYQLFALLFCLFLLSCYFVYKKGMLSDGVLLALCIAGGWLALTALRTKDPRFSLPLVGPMMVITGTWIESWGSGWKSRLAKALVTAVLCLQAYAISFGISWLPTEVVIARGYQGSLRWDWNLYLQHYFHELSAPKREDWKLDAILNRIAGDSRERQIAPDMVLIPDLPRFNSINFQLFARLHGLPSRVDHLQSAKDGLRAFDAFNYVLTTEEDQGTSWTTKESSKLNRLVTNQQEMFRGLGVYRLPNGDLAHLYVILR